jgi:hypothetical protein
MSLSNVTNATVSAGEQFIASAGASALEVTTSHTPQGVLSLFTVLIPTFAERVWQLVSAPFVFPDMQWTLIPLLMTFVAMEIYFFRNVDEELGWNTATTNALVLLFISVDLTRQLFPEQPPYVVATLLWKAVTTGESLGAFMVIVGIASFGLALALISFFHLLPKTVAYKIAGHGPVNFLAYVAIVVVYSAAEGNSVPLDGYMVFAATLLFAALLYAIFLTQRAPGIRVFQRLRGGE